MSNIGTIIDELYKTRQTRLILEREAADLKATESALSKELVNLLSENDLQAGRGQVASFSYKKIEVPNISNWTEVYGFVHARNDFSLLQKRLSEPVWKEYREDGILIPGTEIFETVKTSLTKAGK